MVLSDAYGCSGRQKNDFLFSFPKESVRKKTWTIFAAEGILCQRKTIVHFSKDQLDRDPDKLRENGHDGAKIRLKSESNRIPPPSSATTERECRHFSAPSEA